MSEFIYNIEKIFDHGDNGCLRTNQVDHYYIGPYQRGYKWASKSPYDQVPQLLVDLYKAYSKGIKEYYLQYITVKRVNLKQELGFQEDKFVFEVIDGQQRLTTLSLLFYRICNNEENIAKGKLEYARHQGDGALDKVFSDIQDKITNNTDVSQDEKIDSQDLYYLVKSARCIDDFFKILSDLGEDKERFISYIRESVLLIVNTENSFISSEDIFANLNDNKVSLSNAELIKGLLLTKAVRREDEHGKAYNYMSIIDQRRSMGRMWDEITSWISNSEVSLFFFKTETNGLERMLNLILPAKEAVNKESVVEMFRSKLVKTSTANASVYELYNRFNTAVESAAGAIDMLERIKRTYRRLRHIYEDTMLYNLIGYVLFCKGGFSTIPKTYTTVSLAELETKLINEVSEKLPEYEKLDTGKLDYGADDVDLHRFLLALSVFPEEDNKNYRFDFCSFYREKWSLEHISPQNPPETIVIPNSAKQWVCHSISNQTGIKPETKESLIKKVEEGSEIEVKDIMWLYRKDDFDNVDTVGNMALLGGGVNSALSNQPYVVKRKLLFDKINAGYFVPKHTIDVFSKVLTPEDNGQQFSSDFVEWNQQDVEAHIQWMKDRLEALTEKFENA